MVDIFNFSTYIGSKVIHNGCQHTTLNINPKDFNVIGNLYDKRISTLSYLNISSPDKDEIYLGSYPYQDCEVLECKLCNQIVLWHINDGGIAPRPEYFIMDTTKIYLHEPAVRSVHIQKSLFPQLKNDFPVLKESLFENIPNAEYIELSADQPIGIFNYMEYVGNNLPSISFDMVADRQTLVAVDEWIKKFSQIF